MKILLADDDPISTRIVAMNLRKWGHEIVITNNGLQAWEALQEKDAPRLAILDWMMPGMNGPELCRRVRQETTTAATYLILLTAMNRKEDLVEGIEAGADDYLTKPFDHHELRVRLQAGARIVELQQNLSQRVEELESAIVERKKAEEALRNLTLTDDLTGLYNRRGFFTLAEHYRKIARRSRREALVIYADMDGLKQINDNYGHNEGSQALVKTAEILRQSFRDSDVIARLGGDEFAVLVQDVPQKECGHILNRLRQSLKAYNDQNLLPYPLSLSIGAVRVSPDTSSSIEELVARADQAMYEEKHKKRKAEIVTLTTGEIRVLLGSEMVQ